MLWVLTSAKGSPGVTTTALALAAAGALPPAAAVGPTPTTAPPAARPLLVELDPAGGDLDCWCGPCGEPGLLGAVTDVRSPTSSERIGRHSVEVAPGVNAVLAPTTAASMSAALQSVGESFAETLAGHAGTTIVDLGRWVSPTPAHADRLVRAATAVMVVCRSALASVEHARELVAGLQATSPRVVAVIVGGDRPYPADEVSAAIRAPVAGVLPWDPKGVRALVDHGVSRAWIRSPLSTAASEMANSLRQLGIPQRNRRGARV